MPAPTLTVLMPKAETAEAHAVTHTGNGKYHLHILGKYDPLPVTLKVSDDKAKQDEPITNYPGTTAELKLVVPNLPETGHFTAIVVETGQFPKHLCFLFCSATPVDAAALRQRLREAIHEGTRRSLPAYAVMRITVDLPKAESTQTLKAA